MKILKILITTIVYCIMGWLLCDISPDKEYVWYNGIWHGLFFIYNFIRSLFSDALYKAEFYTTAYNVFYWIFSILSIVIFIIEGKLNRYDY